jgi:hypothetical protein
LGASLKKVSGPHLLGSKQKIWSGFERDSK